MNTILQLRNDCMFVKTHNRNNVLYSELNCCPGSQKLTGHNLEITNILDLEINTDKCIELLFLIENHLYESFGLILIHLIFFFFWTKSATLKPFQNYVGMTFV